MEGSQIEETLADERSMATDVPKDGGTLGDRGVFLDSAPSRIGRFEIKGRLGAGGMGTVFEGYDAELDRKVAIKVVNRGGRENQERLLREAQALARVSHPNVVPVYEVGTHRDAVYIAMEFVDGETLDAWRERTKPDWRAVIDVFSRAGKGLAAAHAKGLVHRDFKPDNVMLGKDGRPRVMDFGLVRGAEDSAPQAEGGEEIAAESLDLDDASLRTSASSKFSETLTHAGALMGTPAYMSPEQFLRLPVDARSDQFSFCASLYEALYGQRAFEGGSLLALGQAVTSGKIRPAPVDSPVPSWLRRAVVRGLSPEPEERWPSIDALLEALADDPSVRRRRVVGYSAAGLAVAVLAGLALAPRGLDGPTCQDGAAQVAEVWNDEVADEVLRSYAGSEAAYTEKSVAQVNAVLAEYGRKLGVADDVLCTEYHRDRAISDEAFDLRRQCLDARTEAFSATVAQVGQGDARTLERADEVLAALPSVAACEDLERLRAVPPPPPEVAEEVATIRADLAKLRVQAASGQRVVDQLAKLRARAEATGYDHVVAQVAVLQASASDPDGKKDAYEHAFVAMREAARLGDGALEFSAMLEVTRAANGPDAERVLAERRRWIEYAKARLDAMGSPPDLELDWRITIADVDRATQRPEVNIDHLLRAVALVEDLYPSPSVRRGQVYANIGDLYGDDGQVALALDYLGKAREEFAATLGEDHPLMGRLYASAAHTASNRGDFELQRKMLREARDIFVRAWGPTSIEAIHTFDDMAIAYDLEGRPEEAKQMLLKALELRGQREGATSADGLQNLNSLCFIEYKLGNLEQAQAECDRALVNADAFAPKMHPSRAIVANNLGLIARARGDFAKALEIDQGALEIMSATLGADSPLAAYSHVGIGESLLGLGRNALAVEVLEKATEIRKGGRVPPGELGEAQCLLARALPKRDLDRAVELATEGLADLVAAGDNWTPQAEACKTWLGANAPSDTATVATR